jgi:hypothetical protein
LKLGLALIPCLVMGLALTLYLMMGLALTIVKKLVSSLYIRKISLLQRGSL